jgi:outer membrane protein OmpA-like peptidoglycan-associated protein
MSSTSHRINSTPGLVAAAVAAILLAACAAAPVKPEGAADARAQLTQLQGDPNLATRVPLAMRDAESAVQLAEQPVIDSQLAAHRVYLANCKVSTARAEAETSYAEDQRSVLTAQREQVLLNARTHEADVATSKVASARSDADIANANAASAQLQAQNAQLQAAELQQQIDLLQAKATDRGLVLTLGDVLFESGKSDLNLNAGGNLNRLVSFMGKYPDRTASIEGHTDSIGTEDFNLGLSQRRADAVRAYLVNQGVEPQRLATAGLGESGPVAGNDSAAGRQQNRRVEVIINNPAKTLQ